MLQNCDSGGQRSVSLWPEAVSRNIDSKTDIAESTSSVVADERGSDACRQDTAESTHCNNASRTGEVAVRAAKA